MIQKYEEAAKRALATNNAEQICKIADHLRSARGFDYEQTMKWFEALGADRDDIEDIFYNEESVNEESTN